MHKQYDFVFPGAALFVISVVMLQSGAIFPEFTETPMLVGFGFMLFFFAFGFIAYKAIKTVM